MGSASAAAVANGPAKVANAAECSTTSSMSSAPESTSLSYVSNLCLISENKSVTCPGLASTTPLMHNRSARRSKVSRAPHHFS